MKSRHIPIVAALLGGLLAASLPVAADQSYEPAAADKVLVGDGHVRHDVGSLHNHVSNWGLIGSRPTQPSTFSHAPSARWNGVDYLWAAGVWFGGTVLGQPLVTTGQFESEFTASVAPGDSIFPAAQGVPGGTRYPWPGADDDGDGAEDEDPLDGLDNDGDGLIDEDFAAAGNQMFRCVMADNYPEILARYPDHDPLNIRVVQESYQWANPLGEDWIGYEYQVTNIGQAVIEGFHCGIFADFDIGQANDDLAGGWTPLDGLARDPWGTFWPIKTGWMRDGAATGAVPGMAGFVFCGLGTRSGGITTIETMDMPSFQIFSGMVPFEQGGDPTNDAERYELMTFDGWDPDVLLGRESDYRFLMSTPEIAAVAPGETVVFRMALVMGDDINDFLGNAAAAAATATGLSFDRDGNPANGEEFQVPWLMPDEAPVPAVTGHIQARRAPGVLSLRFDVRNTNGEQTQVTRRETTGVPYRAWPVEEGTGFITDDDDVGWPRTYDLLLKFAAGSDLVLDSVEVPEPAVVPVSLAVSPNPFNPRLTVEYSLSVAGTARLEILDLRGRLVRVLLDAHLPAGTDRIEWNGLDGQGRAAASGVYLVRLVTEQGFTQQEVTLLR